jgi:hypothetical protein
MYYYSWFDYMAWYNWYYGITPGEPVIEPEPEPETEPVVEKNETTPHEFPSLNFINVAALETEQEQPKNFYREYEKKKRSRIY